MTADYFKRWIYFIRENSLKRNGIGIYAIRLHNKIPHFGELNLMQFKIGSIPNSVFIRLCVWHFDKSYIYLFGWVRWITITLPKHVTWSNTYVLCNICLFDCLFAVWRWHITQKHHNSIYVIHFFFCDFVGMYVLRMPQHAISVTAATATNTLCLNCSVSILSWWKVCTYTKIATWSDLFFYLYKIML